MCNPEQFVNWVGLIVCEPDWLLKIIGAGVLIFLAVMFGVLILTCGVSLWQVSNWWIELRDDEVDHLNGEIETLKKSVTDLSETISRYGLNAPKDGER